MDRNLQNGRVEPFVVIIGIVWLIFPFVVLNFVAKQRAANRILVTRLEEIVRATSRTATAVEAMAKRGDVPAVADLPPPAQPAATPYRI